MPLNDPQGRTINYLRLSVTDRCNPRCSYCMPPQGVADIDHGSILYEELYRIPRSAVAFGLKRSASQAGESPIWVGGSIGSLDHF